MTKTKSSKRQLLSDLVPMPVTMFKANDGQLFTKEEEAAERNVKIYLKTTFAKAMVNNEYNLDAVEQDDRDNKCLYVESIPRFLADNVEIIRRILSTIPVDVD